MTPEQTICGILKNHWPDREEAIPISVLDSLAAAIRAAEVEALEWAAKNIEMETPRCGLLPGGVLTCEFRGSRKWHDPECAAYIAEFIREEGIKRRKDGEE